MLLLALASALALLILFLPLGRSRRATARLQGALAPAAALPSSTTRSIRDLGGRITQMWSAEERARRLEAELALLRLEYRQLQETYERALTRKRALEFGPRWIPDLVPAHLMARDPSTWFNSILLDRGLNEGINRDAGVLSPLGVVGKVIEARPDSAKVLFIIDPACKVAARVARTRQLVIVSGDGRKACRLDYVGGQDDIRPGDRIETAPGGLSFPSGIPIGIVTRVQKLENGLRLGVSVKPLASLDRLEDLFVVGVRMRVAPGSGGEQP